MRERIYAQKGHGAFQDGKKINVSNIKKLNEAYMSYGDIKYFQEINKLSNLLSLVGVTRGHRGIGDFWSYHLLAQGKIDMMLEAKTKIWDIAAVRVIVEEAGGRMTDITGGLVTKETTSIVATNGRLQEIVLKMLQD